MLPVSTVLRGLTFFMKETNKQSHTHTRVCVCVCVCVQCKGEQRFTGKPDRPCRSTLKPRTVELIEPDGLILQPFLAALDYIYLVRTSSRPRLWSTKSNQKAYILYISRYLYISRMAGWTFC